MMNRLTYAESTASRFAFVPLDGAVLVSLDLAFTVQFFQRA